jgi:6-pyruvoyltetrahydropterin/6-carboxytetrahydropterin synthase
MFRLTRAVRFAVNQQEDEQLSAAPANSYAGYPSLTGAGQHFELAVTLAGELDARSSYLINIKRIDQRVREIGIPLVADAVRRGRFRPGPVLSRLHEVLLHAWPGLLLERMQLSLTPFLAWSIHSSEAPMLRLSQKFEFAASHRLHNPQLGDEENRNTFGKCNNPYGHGHNYELQVTLISRPHASGQLIGVPAFERIVAETVIDRFDHRNLNLELPEFRELIPSVENIAMVIYRLLKPKFEQTPAELAAVTVWETPKTWCEYSEGRM